MRVVQQLFRVPPEAALIGILLVLEGALGIVNAFSAFGSASLQAAGPWALGDLFGRRLLLNAAFVAAGIGLLQNRNWARRGAVLLLGLSMLAQLAGVVPGVLAVARGGANSLPLWGIDLWLGTLVALADPLVKMLFLSRPAVLAAWGEEAEGGPLAGLARQMDAQIPAGVAAVVILVALLLIANPGLQSIQHLLRLPAAIQAGGGSARAGITLLLIALGALITGLLALLREERERILVIGLGIMIALAVLGLGNLFIVLPYAVLLLFVLDLLISETPIMPASKE